MPYGERIKPFGFLLSAQVARLAYPKGADPTAFHLIAPFSENPPDWLRSSGRMPIQARNTGFPPASAMRMAWSA